MSREVLPDDAPRKKLIGGEIHRRPRGIPAAVDVVLFRRSTFEARAGWLMSLPAIALHTRGPRIHPVELEREEAELHHRE